MLQKIKAILFEYRKTCILIILALLLNYLKFNLRFIESIYIPYFFKPLSKVLRLCFGWLPFSVGDILYIMLIFFILKFLYNIIKYNKLKDLTKFKYKILSKWLNKFLLLYLIFILIWGILYNRFDKQYFIKNKNKITNEQLSNFYQKNLTELNILATKLNDSISINNQVKITILKNAYDSLNKFYPKLKYEYSSLKPSLFSVPLLSYLGFQGYYNPLTAEAQVNYNLPTFIYPIVALHEMAHQLGYAHEDQANFIAFLAAEHSKNVEVQYAYKFDLMLYTNSLMFAIDSNLQRQLIANVHPKVKSHLNEWRSYTKKYNGKLNDMAHWFYDQYLQINENKRGILSYNDAVLWILQWRMEQRSCYSATLP